jgi:hypothetical protein
MRKHLRNLAQLDGVTDAVRKPSGHVHLLADDGRLLAVASSTPRSPEHALRNVERDVRRALRKEER